MKLECSPITWVRVENEGEIHALVQSEVNFDIHLTLDGICTGLVEHFDPDEILDALKSRSLTPDEIREWLEAQDEAD